MQGRIASKNHVERGVLSGLDILSPRINHYILCAKACRESPDVPQTSGRKACHSRSVSLTIGNREG